METLMRRYSRLIAVTVMTALALPAAAGVSAAAELTQAPRPSAHLVLVKSDITGGSAARMRYTTADLPAGSVVHLQERVAGQGHAWITAARLSRFGTLTAPGAPAGTYLFRVQVTDAGRQVAVSSPTTLTVRTATQAGGANSVLGSIWNWVKHESSAIISAGILALVLSWIGL
jgi:hypothetical protein